MEKRSTGLDESDLNSLFMFQSFYWSAYTAIAFTMRMVYYEK